MNGPNEPRSGPRLILDMSSGTAIIDGEWIELPHKELQILVELAAHPGDVVATNDLIEALWRDVPGITPSDLYSHVSRLRRRIKDRKRTPQLIRNRRGFGYALDLRAEDIRIVEGLALSDLGEPVAPTAEETVDAPAEGLPVEGEMTARVHGAGMATDHGDGPGEEKVPSRRLRPRVATVVLISLIASTALGGSWVAGYHLSQRGQAGAADPSPRSEPEATVQPQVTAQPERHNQGQPRDRPTPRGGNRDGERRNAASTTASGGGTVAAPPGDASDTSKKSPPKSKSSGKNSKPKPPPPPPQPDAQLFHLHHPDTGDRYMTISSSTANQKQAAGYNQSVEGRVFTKHLDGTVAIALDDGTAYVYRSRDAVPQGVSVTELYRLAKAGDFFYTKSVSAANQGEAQGWTRNLAGFVQ